MQLAPDIARQTEAFIDEKQRELRILLRDRIDERDPAFADAFVQALSHLAAAVRTALHAV